MKVDEAIAEIRAIRHEISEEHGHDTKELLDHYKKLEKEYKDRIISRRLSVGDRPKRRQAHA